MSVNVILYSISVIAFVVSLIGVRRLARELALPVVPSICVSGGFMLYGAGLVPGVFGRFTPHGVTLSLVVFSVVFYALLTMVRVKRPHTEDILQQDLPRAQVLLEGRFVFFAVAGFIAANALVRYIFDLPLTLLSRHLKLPWDVVSYHFPVLVDFVQQKSLWSLNVPFQSYSFGYELIGGFPALFFRQHWGFVVANSYAIVFFLAAVFLIIRSIMGKLTAASLSLVMSSFLLTTGIWSTLFASSISAIGKNDIFMSACLLMAFGLLLEYLAEDSVRFGNVRKNTLLMLLTMSLGLAIATKPTALAYLPFFGVVLLVSAVRMQASTTSAKPSFLRGIWRAAALVSGSILIGGFWYLKNFVIFGKIYDPRLSEESFGKSLISNLLDPDLYNPMEGSIIIFFWSCIMLLIPLLLLRQVKRAGNLLHPLILLFLFHLNSLAAFAVTPWAIFHDQKTWDLRLGMPLFTLSAIATSLAVIDYSHRTTFSMPARFLPSAAVSVVLIIALILPAWWSRRMLHGLPGYENIQGLPATDAYAWIQGLKTPVRIYSAGLRPYGLYGRNWQNKVFFDLHSEKLRDDEAVRERTLMVMKVFRADILIISVDPHQGKGTDKPSIINWLRTREYLHEVYNDKAVSIFAVDAGWENHLPDLQISPHPLVMEGWAVPRR